jgi:predicted nucleic acid-binding protein
VIVLDASAITDILLARAPAPALRAALAPHPEVHVPEHFHVEAISALRRYLLRGELSERRATAALDALAELRTVRYPVLELGDAICGGLAAAARADGRLATPVA